MNQTELRVCHSKIGRSVMGGSGPHVVVTVARHSLRLRLVVADCTGSQFMATAERTEARC